MQVEQSREKTWPGQNRAEQSREEESWGELRRTDRLRHPDTAIPRRTRGGTVRQSTSKAEHSSGTAFDEAQLNSTRLDWVWVWVWVWVLVRGWWWICWWGRRQPVIVSKFSCSVSSSLCLFPGNSAFSNWNVLHHISAHYHLLLAPQRSRHLKHSLALSSPAPSAKCPSRFERVQRATCNNNNLAK